MKSYLIYSGKGGVGKTTTTANVAKYMSQHGKRVFVIDADINTPSMHTVFNTPTPSESLRIASLGYSNKGMIYMQGSMIRQYMKDSVKNAMKFNADIVLIDTPPSITDVHMQLLRSISISGILFVTQPSTISMSDVVRTSQFFLNHKIPSIGIVENMSQGESVEYPYELVAKVSFDKSFNHNIVYNNNIEAYCKIASMLTGGNDLKIMQRQLTHNIFSDTPSISDITDGRYSSIEDFDTEERFGFYVSKPKKFINFATWDFIRYEILETMPYPDGYLYETAERLKEMCKPFLEEEECYFMVIKPPSTEIELIRGEIGKCTLQLGLSSYYGLPRVLYHTRYGTVTLFRHEVMYISSEQMQQHVSDGYIPIDDGRYMPNDSICEQIDNVFGMAPNNWQDILAKNISSCSALNHSGTT